MSMRKDCLLVLTVFSCLFNFDIKASNKNNVVKRNVLEMVPVLQQKPYEMICGYHSLKNADLGLQLIQSEDGSEDAQKIRNLMRNKIEFWAYISDIYLKQSFWQSFKGVDDRQMFNFIKQKDLEDKVFLISADFFQKQLRWNTRNVFNEQKALKEFVKHDFVKSFLISTGMCHLISCSIKKENGVVTKVLGMNSFAFSSNNIFMFFARKFYNPRGLSDKEAIELVVDLANDTSWSSREEVEFIFER